MIIDIHTHIFPDEIASRAVNKLKRASHTQPFCDGTSAGLQESCTAAGVDCCVTLPVATDPKQVLHMNDRAILANGLYPESCLLPFGAIHPDCPGWKSELKRLACSGIRGVKIHPVFQKVRLDDLRYLRIIDAAAGLGLIVLAHAGLDIDSPDEIFCTPEMILQVYRELGEIPFILAHMGGWRQWDEAEYFVAQTPFYLDTAYCLGPVIPLKGSVWTGGSLKTMPEKQFLRFVKIFGADRLLFGSDSPWRDQKKSIDEINALPLSGPEKSAILGGNAARLLKAGNSMAGAGRQP